MVEEGRRRKVAAMDPKATAARERNAKNQRNFHARVKARRAEAAAAIARCEAAIAEARAERQRVEETGRHLARVFWVQQALWTVHCRVPAAEGAPAAAADAALAALRAMVRPEAAADLGATVEWLPPGGALAERIAAALLPQLSPEQRALVRASAREYDLQVVPACVSAPRWVRKFREMECEGEAAACSAAAAAAAAAQEAALAASWLQDAIARGTAARKKVYDTVMACLTPEQLAAIERSFDGFEPDFMCVALHLQQMARQEFKLIRQRSSPTHLGCTAPSLAWSAVQ